MSISDRIRWDEKYSSRESSNAPPDEWLVESVCSLEPGYALDVACGLGHNAIWLAEQGWQVDAVDISPVGLALAAESARRQDVNVRWLPGDLESDSWQPPRVAYDLIVVFRFLDRSHLPRLIQDHLAPGGLLVYETFTEGHLSRPDNHLRTSTFALKSQELLELYSGLTPLSYEEVALHDRTVARLMARRDGEIAE